MAKQSFWAHTQEKWNHHLTKICAPTFTEAFTHNVHDVKAIYMSIIDRTDGESVPRIHTIEYCSALVKRSVVYGDTDDEPREYYAKWDKSDTGRRKHTENLQVAFKTKSDAWEGWGLGCQGQRNRKGNTLAVLEGEGVWGTRAQHGDWGNSAHLTFLH